MDNSKTIRAASKNKPRSQTSQKAAASPFGSSAGGSLASSLSSLFSPQPHGKDAALASLLAANSKPPVNLGPKSGLAAFGTFGSSNPPATPAEPSKAAVSQLLDDRQKGKSRETVSPAAKTDVASATAGASSSKNAAKEKQQHKQVASTDARQSTSAAATAANPSKSVVPNVPARRKPVFRPVLASSTAVNWPEMPVAGSKTVLHTLLEVLAQPVAQEALYRDLGRRSRSTAKQEKEASAMQVDVESEPSRLPPTQILAGTNSVTRALEADIATDLEQLHSSDSGDAKGKEKAIAAPPSVKIVFVCRHDVPSPTLISHLPMLVTARNAVSHACATPDSGVLLFALPPSSSPLLAKALNLRRASIIALTSAFSPTHLAQLLVAIERETGSVCHLRASWLETALLAAKRSGSMGGLGLTQQPTTIKLLRTTQPVDLNACKAAKKSRRKERSARWRKKKMQLQQSIRSLRAELKYEAKKERKTRKAGKIESQLKEMDTT